MFTLNFLKSVILFEAYQGGQACGFYFTNYVSFLQKMESGIINVLCVNIFLYKLSQIFNLAGFYTKISLGGCCNRISDSVRASGLEI